MSQDDQADILRSVNYVLSRTGFGVVTITIKNCEVAEIATTVTTHKPKGKSQLLT